MKSFFLILLIVCGYNGFSQKTAPAAGQYKIKGKILDSTTNQPVEYATVTILSSTGTVAGGMITDEKGAFTVENLAAGEYAARVEFIGYAMKTVNNVVLGDGHPIGNLGTVKIAGNSKNLDAVTVTGAKNFMENHLDKFVYNVEKDVTSQGGVATDILKKVPQVSVDVDGNVELLGSSNLRVFINGKPSTMFDNNLAEALQAIPASQIKSIEVITSPGAQYDAQGTGGIINIILKDNKSEGINGNIALSGGTRLNNGSANIHARKGHVDLSASLSGNEQLKGTTINSMNRTEAISQTLQQGTGTLERNGYRGQLGMDWAISKKDDLTASVSYNNFGGVTNAITNQQQITFVPSDTLNTIRNSTNTFRYRAADWNVNYIKKFNREGQELSLSYQENYGRGSTYYDETETGLYGGLPIKTSGGNGNNRLKDFETYLIADYSHPLAGDIMINTGAKGSFTRISSYSDDYPFDFATQRFEFDSSGLNNFLYNRDVYAGYISATFPLFKVYSVKVGVRDEYTAIQIPNDTFSLIPADTGKFNPNYNSIIPSIIMSRKLGNNQTLKASYYRRLQRAGYRELNPFIDATDPTTLMSGNPHLRPERTNAGELSYFKFFESGSSILVTLYYRNTQDDEQSYVVHYANLIVGNRSYGDVTITTNENAGHQQLTGLNISGTLSLSKKLEVRGNAILFDKYITGIIDTNTTSNSLNYRINGNATYQITKTLIAEFFGSFNSPRTEIQGKFPSFTSYSFAIRQLLFKKKASVAFTTTDPFNKYTNQPTVITGDGFTLNSDRKIPYRSFGLSFTYKFGKMEYKEKKQEKSDLNSDENN